MKSLASYVLLVAGLGAVALGALASCGRADAGAPAGAAPRIVSIGGAVTETVFALGAGAQVVAVDTSSVYPPAATGLPHVGYQRQLSAEGILAQRPTLVLAIHDAGPAAVLEQLRDSGVRVVRIGRDGFDTASAAEKITQVAAALERPAEGRALVARLDGELAAAGALAGRAGRQPRVLFVYARGPGAAHVSGTETAADAMIRLAGGTNAVAGFTGFKPLTAEAVVQAAPEVVLVPTRGLESLGGVDGLLAQPGMALTPAGQARRVVAIDDVVLLGFGPRLGQGLRELALALHPELAPGTGASP